MKNVRAPLAWLALAVLAAGAAIVWDIEQLWWLAVVVAAAAAPTLVVRSDVHSTRRGVRTGLACACAGAVVLVGLALPDRLPWPGAPGWRIDGSDESIQARSGDVLIAGGNAYDLDDGERLWSVPKNGYVRGIVTEVVVVAVGHELLGLDLQSGERRWRVELSDDDAAEGVLGFGEERVIVGDGVLDATTGKVVWRPAGLLSVSRDGLRPLQLADDFEYVLDLAGPEARRGTVRRVDDGAELGTVRLEPEFAIRRDLLLVDHADTARVHAIELVDGTARWTGGPGGVGPPVALDEHPMVDNPRRAVFDLETGTTTPLDLPDGWQEAHVYQDDGWLLLRRDDDYAMWRFDGAFVELGEADDHSRFDIATEGRLVAVVVDDHDLVGGDRTRVVLWDGRSRDEFVWGRAQRPESPGMQLRGGVVELSDSEHTRFVDIGHPSEG